MKQVLQFVGTLAVILLALAVALMVYDECREMGFSLAYCVLR